MNLGNKLTGLLGRFAKEEAPAKDTSAKAGLYKEEATSQLIEMLTRLPDLDEVLRQAGIRRDKLRVLMYDDEISQACETRCDALVATPVRLEPSDSQQAKFAWELIKPHIENILQGAFAARLFGYSVLEAVYEVKENGYVGFKFIGEKPFNWFEPKPDGSLFYYPDDGSGGTTGILVDQKFKFFLTRSKPTYIQPFGEALLSRLYWPWYFRTNGWKFWAKFLERFGSPLLVGKGTDPEKMVTALLAAHSQAVMGIGREDEVQVVSAPSTNGDKAFDTFESAIIRRIQKVVLGQTLTSGTDGGSGNRALGDVHDTVRLDKRNSDIGLVMPTVQRIVDALCAVNGWPKFEVVFGDEVGLEEDRAARDKDLYAVGVRFKEGYFQDNYSLRAEDFELSSEAPLGAITPGLPGTGVDGKPSVDKKKADKPVTSSAKEAKAAQSLSTFSSRGGLGAVAFTKQQAMIEEQADEALSGAGQPLDPEKVRAAVLAASNPEDLADRLFALVGDSVSQEQFQATLERALYAADVLGYVHAEGKV